MSQLIVDTIVWILAALALAAAGYVLLRRRNALGIIKGTVLNLIKDAERSMGGGVGLFKKSLVIELIIGSDFYKGLPAVVQGLITANMLGGIIDAVCEVFKRQLESNRDNVGRLLNKDGEQSEKFTQ